MKKQLPTLALVLTAMIWGFAFIGVDSALGSGWKPFEILFSRGLVGAVFLSFFSLKYKWYKNKKTLILGFICGILTFIPYALQTIGQASSGVQNSAIFTSLNIIFIPFIMRVIFRKKLEKKVIIAAIIAFIGTFIITFNESMIANKFNLFIVLQNIASSLKFSDILLILCGLGFAIQIIFCGYCAKCDNPLSITTIQLFTMALISLIFMPLFGQTNIMHSNGWMGVIFVAIFSSAIASVLQIYAQKKVKPTTTSIILCQETTIACIASVLILHDAMNFLEVLGLMLMILAVLIVEIKFSKKQKVIINQYEKIDASV